jgi:serine protease
MSPLRPFRRPGAAIAAILACALVATPAQARPPTAAPSTAAHATATHATAAPAAAAATKAAAPAAQYAPGEVVVGYTSPPSARLRAQIASRTGATPASAATPDFQVLRIPRGETVAQAIARLRAEPDVAYASPDYLAHEAGGWIPNDRGRLHVAEGWAFLQWNFLGGAGVDAPDAWSHLFADGAPGGRGVTVAILDTGVAYTNWVSPQGQRFRESPDFVGTRFVAPCDVYREMVVNASKTSPRSCTEPYALDRQGHGTFVAGVVAETTNNGVGVTGLAWGSSIMPVRVLDSQGNGDSATIAEGIRYATLHGAQVINLSLEFDPSVGAADIPDVIAAITFAHRHGVTVVAAAGNDYLPNYPAQVTYPARDPNVISVGATTFDRCRASYSNVGPGLDLVAPGGGDDAQIPGDPNCYPSRNLFDIYQLTFPNPSDPLDFSLPDGWFGTSMSAPHVAAAAALVIASGVLGANPSPDQILSRLEATAQPLGTAPAPNADYGYGLLNVGAATAGVSKTAAARAHRRQLRHRRRIPKAHRAK